jgi:5-methylcytosine-specific restriction endonuclease McrA
MRHIPLPRFSVTHVLDVMEPSNEVSRIIAKRAELAANEAAYVETATRHALHELPRQEPSLVAIEDDLYWAYDNRLAEKDHNGRQFYELLREIDDDFGCPSCLRREIEALDHYLPRSKYKHLSVTPANLVPVCNICNNIKRAHAPANEEDHLLHPYFDDLGTFEWLRVTLTEEEGAPVVFRVEPPARWNEVLSLRAERHFTKFRLGKLYSKQVTRFLNNIRLTLSEVFEAGGTAAVRAQLQDYLRSWNRGNSEPWNSAALAAWIESDWFCGGGFGALELAHDDMPTASEVGIA